METGGGHDNLPIAVRAKDRVGTGRASVIVALNGHDGVFKLVEKRHFVVEGHRGTRHDIGEFLNDNAVALHDNLVERSQRLACHGFGRIGPGEVADTRDIVVDAHAQVFGSFRHGVIDIIRDEIVDDSLTSRIVEMLAIDEEIAVGRATPTPVEIEEAIVVVAVANESMTALAALARIIHRDMLVNVRLQQSNPFIVGMTRLGDVCSFVGIREISIDGNRDIRRVGAAAIGCVHHVDRYATMVHKSSDSYFLFLSCATVVYRNHVVPIVSSLTKVGVLLTITHRKITMFTCSRHWPFPILHQLGHGCRHATRRAATRSIHVIRRILIPFQLYQGPDHREIPVGMHDAVGLKILPAADDVSIGSTTLLHHRFDAARNFAQHETQAIWSSFIVEIAMVGITENRRRAVVGSHDDEAAFEIEDVCRGQTTFSTISISQIEVVHRVFGKHGLMLDEIAAQTLRRRHINGLGLHCCDAQQ